MLAQTFFATVTQHLWNKKVTDEFAKIVNDEWKMKRHTIKQQSGKKAITQDTPHFKGPDGKIDTKNRAVLLDNINKYVARGSPTTLRPAAEDLWLAQDKLFVIWRTIEPDASKWLAFTDKAREAPLEYCDLFVDLCSKSEGIITMYYAIHH